MRYIGGKSKIAKGITEAILTNSVSRKYYLEPFVGGGAVFPIMAPHFEWSVAGDTHEDLILMWNALIFEGWEPPTGISESDYQSLRNDQPSPLRSLAGFGGSFGGKWFGGYARGGKNADGSPRNHQGESARSLIAARSRIHSELTPSRVGRFRHQSYREWKPIPGTVVYADPPYTDTQGYATGEFDSGEFWGTMEEWGQNGCEVFVSEYAAPDGWVPIWSASHRQSLVRPEQGRSTTVENLFARGK